jgi:pimeloyl-ACP methyl ester carboxylesterase
VSSRRVSRIQIVVVILFAGFVSTPASRAAPASATEQQSAPYLTPQLLVEVGERRTINLVCLGYGSPTVILSAGLEGWSAVWWMVQRPLAERTRVCAWDRAGFGFSSPSQERQDIVHTTKDLERALTKGGIRGPYVMVGHSLGAFETLRFTDLHRQSVVGMLLVDPDIPDRAATLERIVPQLGTLWRANNERTVKELQNCAEGLRGGTLQQGTPKFKDCTGSPDILIPGLTVALARLNRDPARLLTQASTAKEHSASSREVINAQRRYGDMPLIVLTAGRYESSALSAMPPDTPGASAPAELVELQKLVARYSRDAWGPAHDAYAALSTRGRNELVPDSSHTIQMEKPEAVISAVTEILDESRSRTLHEP